MRGVTELEHHLQAAQTRLTKLGTLPEVFAKRGLNFEQAVELGLGVDAAGSGIIPIRSLDGVLIGLKGRFLRPDRHKYFEWPEDNKNSPWYAPDVLQAQAALLFVEGELNAMTSWLTLRETSIGVVGLGSAFGPLDFDLAARLNLPIFFTLDDDTVGRKSSEKWLTEAWRRGRVARRVGPLMGALDACEYAHLCGLNALRTRWLQLLGSGT